MLFIMESEFIKGGYFRLFFYSIELNFDLAYHTENNLSQQLLLQVKSL